MKAYSQMTNKNQKSCLKSIMMTTDVHSGHNKPSQREFHSLKNTHKIPCLGRYLPRGGF
jgi:hypothetical protein